MKNDENDNKENSKDTSIIWIFILIFFSLVVKLK